MNGIYRALAHEHRRGIVRALERERDMTIDELTRRLLNGTDDADERARRRVRLAHIDIPMLEDHGVVAHVDDTVARGAKFWEALSVLNAPSTESVAD